MLKKIKEKLEIKKTLKNFKNELKNIKNLNNKKDIKEILNSIELNILDFQGKYFLTKHYSEKLDCDILHLLFEISLLRKKHLGTTISFNK